MRIIAGEFGGRVLKAPKGDGTRPTTERVRESIMSIVHSARDGFEGAVVLDAFAGSGALGLEALSRGACYVQSFEFDNQAFRILSGNVKTLGLDSRQIRLVRADVLKDVPTRVMRPFDLVFLDPPYAYLASDILGFLNTMKEHQALAQNALIVYEHGKSSNSDVQKAAEGSGFSLVQRKKYGDTIVDILRACEDELPIGDSERNCD